MTEWIRGSGATISALVLAAVFAWAAAAKVRSRRQTEADFASLGLVGAPILAVIVPMVELMVVALLVLTPGWGGVVAAAALTGFTIIIVRILRDPKGLTPTCACFGGSNRSPLSYRHVIRNSVLITLALVAATFEGVLSPLLAFVLY